MDGWGNGLTAQAMRMNVKLAAHQLECIARRFLCSRCVENVLRINVVLHCIRNTGMPLVRYLRRTSAKLEPSAASLCSTKDVCNESGHGPLLEQDLTIGYIPTYPNEVFYQTAKKRKH